MSLRVVPLVRLPVRWSSWVQHTHIAVTRHRWQANLPWRENMESFAFKGFLTRVWTLLFQEGTVKQPSSWWGFKLSTSLTLTTVTLLNWSIAHDGCLYCPLMQTTCIRKQSVTLLQADGEQCYLIPVGTGREKQIDKELWESLREMVKQGN